MKKIFGRLILCLLVLTVLFSACGHKNEWEKKPAQEYADYMLEKTAESKELLLKLPSLFDTLKGTPSSKVMKNSDFKDLQNQLFVWQENAMEYTSIPEEGKEASEKLLDYASKMQTIVEQFPKWAEGNDSESFSSAMEEAHSALIKTENALSLLKATLSPYVTLTMQDLYGNWMVNQEWLLEIAQDGTASINGEPVTMTLNEDILTFDYQNEAHKWVITAFSPEGITGLSYEDSDTEEQSIVSVKTDVLELSKTLINQNSLELSLQKAYYSDTLSPSNIDPTAGYPYYQKKDTDSTYLIAEFRVKNKATQTNTEAVSDVLSVSAVYLDKYVYAGDVIAEKPDGTSLSANLNLVPLSEGLIYAKISVPKTVQNETPVLKLFFNSQLYFCPVPVQTLSEEEPQEKEDTKDSNTAPSDEEEN